MADIYIYIYIYINDILQVFTDWKYLKLLQDEDIIVYIYILRKDDFRNPVEYSIIERYFLLQYNTIKIRS